MCDSSGFVLNFYININRNYKIINRSNIASNVNLTKFYTSHGWFLLFNQRVSISKDTKLWKAVLEMAHKSMFTIHPGSYKYT